MLNFNSYKIEKYICNNIVGVNWASVFIIALAYITLPFKWFIYSLNLPNNLKVEIKRSYHKPSQVVNELHQWRIV